MHLVEVFYDVALSEPREFASSPKHDLNRPSLAVGLRNENFNIQSSRKKFSTLGITVRCIGKLVNNWWRKCCPINLFPKNVSL